MANASPQPNDLTTLAALNQYLQMPVGTPQTDTADELQRLLSAASLFFLGLLWRKQLVSQTYSEVRDGTDGQRMYLKNPPCTAVSLVQVNGLAIAASPDGIQPGYVFNKDAITLIGSSPTLAGASYYTLPQTFYFTRGFSNVLLNYTGGYVPKVAVPWAPSTAYLVGQYVLDSNGNVQQSTTPGTSGSSAPSWATPFGATTLDAAPLVWTLVPPDLEMSIFERAVLELCAQKWKRRQHQDEVSQSIGGQMTTSFSQRDIPAEVQAVIDRYKFVLPIS